MSSLDYYILIPIVLRFIAVGVTLNYLDRKSVLSPLIILLVGFLGLLSANFFRKLEYCGKKSDYSKNNSVYMSSATADTFIEIGVTEFLMGLYNIFIFKHLRNTSNSGDVKNILIFAFFTNALWSLVLKDIYSIVNKSKEGEECKILTSGSIAANASKYTIGIILLILGFIMYYMSFIKISFKADYD